MFIIRIFINSTFVIRICYQKYICHSAGISTKTVALIQQLIATEDEYILNTIWSLLFDNSQSKISDFFV